MRIKLLATIASFILTSIAMSSCLGDDTNNIEYSPNAVVMAFELDTIHGVNYVFTIDQLNGHIYNQDSLPVGSDTIIDKVLIKKLTIAGFATIRNSANTEDSLLNIADSLNLVGTMQKPFEFKVWAPDLVVKKNYRLEVRVHQQTPDSLNWGDAPWATNFAPTLSGKQKSVLLGDNIFTYATNGSVFSTSLVDGKSWNQSTVSGLPNTNITSLVNFKGTLYATVEGATSAYASTDGISWADASLGNNITTFIAPMSNVITAIRTVEETNGDGATQMVERFCNTDGASWSVGEVVPASFPRNNISSTVFNNRVGVENVMVVGNVVNPTASDTATVAWGYMEGQKWSAMTTESIYICPKMDDPSIMYYGDAFYIFGKDFSSFYKSQAGLVWKKETKMFMLPAAIRNQVSDYSMVVGPNNFIWIMRSTPNEVWRGRLNRLGFKMQ